MVPILATLLSTSTRGNITWIYTALTNLLGESTTAIALPPTFPGTISTLLWWASEYLQSITVAFLTGGIETFWSMILRSAIQRTYATHSAECSRSDLSTDLITMTISSSGLTFGLVFCSVQLLMCMLSLLAILPWVFSEAPIYPAVRAAADSTYFNILHSWSVIGTSNIH
jgi:hypothetical protein